MILSFPSISVDNHLKSKKINSKICVHHHLCGTKSDISAFELGSWEVVTKSKESLCCLPETATTFLAIYPNTK